MKTFGMTARKALGAFALVALIPISGWAFGGPGMGGRFQGPPQEAFDACNGKKAGDEVRFATPCGDNVMAVCREFDGKLAAAPGKGPGWRGKGPGRGGRGMGAGMGRGMGGGRHFDRVAADLGLTAEQRERIKGILDAERDKNAEARRQLRDSRGEWRKIALKTPFDEAAVRKAFAEKEKVKAELAVSKARAMSKAYEVLTPEQKEKAGKLGTFGMGFGMGPGMGPGPGCRDCPRGN